MTPTDPEDLLRSLFAKAVCAADPKRHVAKYLPEQPTGRIIVVGAGKASAAMAAAVEAAWPDAGISGLVVVPYGHGVSCDGIDMVEARHPVPDDNGLRAATEIMSRVTEAAADDLVLCLISGGGSALLPLPPEGVSLEAEQAVQSALLSSGASIGEINCVRKHLSLIKGGRLAQAAAPAKLCTLLISDVPGDDPSTIASGPTVPDPTTRAQAAVILARYGINVPESIKKWLATDASETPKPGDPAFANSSLEMIATPQMSLEAAAAMCASKGIAAHILSDAIEGESRDVAAVMAAIVRQVAVRRQPFAPPCVILSGGETTVTVRGNGRGGRNVEFLLACALALDADPNIWAIACDTDGVDGAEAIAGAVISPETLKRAAEHGLDPSAMLADNDAHGFFEALGDQVITGPTLTNVNDFRAVLVLAR